VAAFGPRDDVLAALRQAAAKAARPAAPAAPSITAVLAPARGAR